MSPEITPSQTVGPYFHICLEWGDAGKYVAPAGTDGLFRLHGHILDGTGDPIPDAMIETWQADADGRFDHPDDPRGAVSWQDFTGFGRCSTDEDGFYEIFTIKPGTFLDRDGVMEAAHLNVSVFSRGLLARLVTRIYFDDEQDSNAADPVLARVPEERRGTLIAVSTEDGYRHDIHTQGPSETVFFDV
ncbi:MAG TPA: protocatechuate 3,4-dioxygenase subunit alpha [Baekduia sp.]|nr:protocatechuate 3,4-dioxygenase subunit alpha [Baekduia sp.]